MGGRQLPAEPDPAPREVAQSLAPPILAPKIGAPRPRPQPAAGLLGAQQGHGPWAWAEPGSRESAAPGWRTPRPAPSRGVRAA